MKVLFDLSGKTALIAGASKGLGCEIALGLAAAGAKVILAGRYIKALDRVAQQVSDAGGSAECLVMDVADKAGTDAPMEAIEKSENGLDILVNAVGMRDRKPLDDFKDGDFEGVLNVNLTGAFYLSRAAANLMKRRGYGRIIHVTSIAGPIARAGDAAYTASKGGLSALVNALAAELGGDGITVNAIAPGYFATETNQGMIDDPDVAEWLSRRTSLGRWGQPQEIAGAAVYLASPAASYVTGHTLTVDGGYSSHF